MSGINSLLQAATAVSSLASSPSVKKIVSHHQDSILYAVFDFIKKNSDFFYVVAEQGEAVKYHFDSQHRETYTSFCRGFLQKLGQGSGGKKGSHDDEQLNPYAVFLDALRNLKPGQLKDSRLWKFLAYHRNKEFLEYMASLEKTNIRESIIKRYNERINAYKIALRVVISISYENLQGFIIARPYHEEGETRSSENLINLWNHLSCNFYVHLQQCGKRKGDTLLKGIKSFIDSDGKDQDDIYNFVANPQNWLLVHYLANEASNIWAILIFEDEEIAEKVAFTYNFLTRHRQFFVASFKSDFKVWVNKQSGSIQETLKLFSRHLVDTFEANADLVDTRKGLDPKLFPDAQACFMDCIVGISTKDAVKDEAEEKTNKSSVQKLDEGNYNEANRKLVAFLLHPNNEPVVDYLASSLKNLEEVIQLWEKQFLFKSTAPRYQPTGSPLHVGKSIVAEPLSAISSSSSSTSPQTPESFSSTSSSSSPEIDETSDNDADDETSDHEGSGDEQELVGRSSNARAAHNKVSDDEGSDGEEELTGSADGRENNFAKAFKSLRV